MDSDDALDLQARIDELWRQLDLREPVASGRVSHTLQFAASAFTAGDLFDLGLLERPAHEFVCDWTCSKLLH